MYTRCLFIFNFLIISFYALFTPYSYAEEEKNTTRQQQIEFNISAQSLLDALTQLAKQAGIQLSISNAAQGKMAGYEANSIDETLSLDDAVKRLLANTEFNYNLNTGKLSVDFIPPTAPEEDALKLDEVVIMGTREKEWIYSDPNTTTIISKEELERLPPLHAADMLAEAAGVFVAEDRSNSGIAVNIRGMQDFGRVNMSVDGARQNYQQTGHGVNGHAYVDPALIRQIQIEKGPTASVNGAGVIGGIVNFQTINASDVLGAKKKAGLMLNGTKGLGDLGNGYDYSGSVAGAFRMGGFDFLAALSQKEMKAYKGGSNGHYSTEEEEPERVRNMVTSRTYQKLSSHFIKTGYDFSAISRLEFSYNRFMDDSNSKRGNSKANSTKITSDNYKLKYNYDEFSIAAKFTQTINNTHLNPKAMFSSFDVHYQTDTFGLSLDNANHFRFKNNEFNIYYGGEYHLDRTLPEAQQIKYDIVQKESDYSSSFSGTTPKGDRALASLFGRFEWNYDNYIITSLGLRYDHYQLVGKTYYYLGNKHGKKLRTSIDYCLKPKGQNDDICYNALPAWGPVLVNRNKGMLLPSFSVGVNVYEGVQPFITYAKGWRPPAITEALMYGLHLGNDGPPSAPNPFSKEEISNTWEAGLNLKFDNIFKNKDKFRAKLAAYENRVENYMAQGSIFYPSLNIGYLVDKKHYINTASFVNLNKPLTYTGLELEADYEYDWLYLKASISQTHLDYSSNYEPLVNDKNERFKANLKAIQSKKFVIMVKPPKYKIALNTEFRFLDKKLRVGVRARYMSKNGLAGGPQNELVINESYVFDIYQSYQYKNATMRVSVENLFDRLYATPISLGGVNIGPGTTALLTVGLKI